MSMEQRPAEHYFEQAEEEWKAGNLERALSLLNIAITKSPHEMRYQQALTAMRQQMLEADADAEASGAAMREAANAAYRETSESEAEESAPVVNPVRARVIKISVLVLLICATVVVLWSRGSHSVNVSPYQAILPVTSAVRPGQASEVVLKVSDSAWSGLTAEQRSATLKELLTVAHGQGFDRVFLYNEHENRLASGSDEMLWLSP